MRSVFLVRGYSALAAGFVQSMAEGIHDNLLGGHAGHFHEALDPTNRITLDNQLAHAVSPATQASQQPFASARTRPM